MASLDELKKKYLKNNQTEQKTQTTSKSTKSTTSSGKKVAIISTAITLAL